MSNFEPLIEYLLHQLTNNTFLGSTNIQKINTTPISAIGKYLGNIFQITTSIKKQTCETVKLLMYVYDPSKQK